MTFPTSASELVFPSTSNSLSSTLSSLHRSSNSCSNRLASIAHDSSFVCDLHSLFHLPLIANERCGSWYIPPAVKTASAYFKSTDGHTGQWAFSCRRLNLHLLDYIGKHNGCIIVDSTRRGKSMPDALAKTIPIWCAVLNQLLFGTGEVSLPEHVVGDSERAQVEERLGGWVEDAKALNLDLPRLRATISRPLQPFWITPGSISADLLLPSPSCSKIICCTASRFIDRPEASDGNYIQGAADDSESWAHGLTPALFWAHSEQLLEATEDGLPALIARLIHSSKDSNIDEEQPTLIQPTSTIFIGTTNTLNTDKFDGTIICSPTPTPPTTANPAPLILPIATSKPGSRALRSQLSRVPPYIQALRARVPNPKILFICATGRDLSAGVALAALCLFYNNSGGFKDKEEEVRIDKLFIRQRLAWLTSSKADINPSRATLQAVNSFLMAGP
ncbi:MAG: hypothetical protein Q9195_001182 [Heterodermia aff. obscurata]